MSELERRSMSQDEQAALDAIKAVLAVAASNFPRDTPVEILAPGKNHASIVIPHYLLSMLLGRIEALK